ncbi:MAG: DUF309 domain-containing protein [Gemmataceae bacterium]|nr:DUF309 domain-containing protein [Gemmataceae bacterium]
MTSPSERDARLAPDMPFPPYAYVPGGPYPHPIRDPQGHGFGIEAPRPASPDPEDWRSCVPYLYGIDLFNCGYYWEAHEAWESLWHACGRTGPMADFLKGLIKLAAAGVKVREGEPRGVHNHARRAAELFAPMAGTRYLGLAVNELIAFADQLNAQSTSLAADRTKVVEVIFDYGLRPA